MFQIAGGILIVLAVLSTIKLAWWIFCLRVEHRAARERRAAFEAHRAIPTLEEERLCNEAHYADLQAQYDRRVAPTA